MKANFSALPLAGRLTGADSAHPPALYPIRGSGIVSPVEEVSNSVPAAVPTVRRRYKSLIASAFLISLTLALAAAAQQPTLNQAPTHNQQSAPTVSTPAVQEDTTMSNQNAANPLSQNNNNVGSDTTSGTASNQNDVHVQVSVNGQNVPVPSNGSTTQTISSDGGTTTVHVEHSQSSSGNSASTSVTTRSDGSTSFSMFSNSGSSPP